MFSEDKDFKLDPKKIPDDVDIKYGYSGASTVYSAFDLSKKIDLYESRLKKIDEAIETLRAEKEAMVFMAQAELTNAPNNFPRFGRGYEMFVKGRDNPNYSENNYFYLGDKLAALEDKDAKKEDLAAASVYIEDFITLFFQGGGMLDIKYAVDFVNVTAYQSSLEDAFPPVTAYVFMTTFPREVEIEQKEVCFSFYDPWLLRSWRRKEEFLSQWRNAQLGKIYVTVTDLTDSTNVKGTHDRGIPGIYCEDFLSGITMAPLDGTTAFRSFNPYEIAAWLQLKIMHLKENKFTKTEKTGEDNSLLWVQSSMDHRMLTN